MNLEATINVTESGTGASKRRYYSLETLVPGVTLKDSQETFINIFKMKLYIHLWAPHHDAIVRFNLYLLGLIHQSNTTPTHQSGPGRRWYHIFPALRLDIALRLGPVAFRATPFRPTRSVHFLGSWYRRNCPCGACSTSRLLLLSHFPGTFFIADNANYGSGPRDLMVNMVWTRSYDGEKSFRANTERPSSYLRLSG